MRTTSTRLGVSVCHLLFGTSAKSMKLDAKATERALNELNVSRLPNAPVPLEFALGEGLCVGSQSSSASSPMSEASSAAPTRLDPLESSDTPLLDVPSGSGSPLELTVPGFNRQSLETAFMGRLQGKKTARRNPSPRPGIPGISPAHERPLKRNRTIG